MSILADLWSYAVEVFGPLVESVWFFFATVEQVFYAIVLSAAALGLLVCIVKDLQKK